MNLFVGSRLFLLPLDMTQVNFHQVLLLRASKRETCSITSAPHSIRYMWAIIGIGKVREGSNSFSLDWSKAALHTTVLQCSTYTLHAANLNHSGMLGS